MFLPTSFLHAMLYAIQSNRFPPMAQFPPGIIVHQDHASFQHEITLSTSGDISQFHSVIQVHSPKARGWLNQDMVKRESWCPVLDEQKSWISLAVRLEENSVASGRTWMCMVDVLERKTTASFIVPEVGRSM